MACFRHKIVNTLHKGETRMMIIIIIIIMVMVENEVKIMGFLVSKFYDIFMRVI
jgi:hypothetical protein